MPLISWRVALAAMLAAAGLAGRAPGGEVEDLARMLWDADSGKRVEAARALGRRGSSALAALPHLVEALLDEEPEVKRAAADALAKLGPAAVPTLTSVVAEAEGEERLLVIGALASIAESSPEAVAVLTRSLDSPDQTTRRGLLQVIGMLGSKGKPALPALLLAAVDDDEEIAAAAAAALAGIGDPALPGLMAAAKTVRRPLALVSVARTALDIDPEKLRELLGAVKDVQDADTLEAVAAACRRAGARQVPRLAEALQTGDARLMVAAAAVLAKMGAEGRPALEEGAEALERGLREKDPFVRAQCAERLGEISASSGPVLEVLHQALGDGDGEVRMKAAQALARKREAALPGLLRALKTADEAHRGTVLVVLMGLAAESPAAVETLLGALKDPDWRVASGAASALGAAPSSAAPEVVPALKELKTHRHPAVRQAAEEALSLLEPEPR